jgi:hypothetical protein
MNLPSMQVDIVSLRGGIDLASTFVRIPPGSALNLLNFEPELEGGYRRVSGYERVDGRKAPSTALYYTLEVNNGELVALNSTLVGQSSGASGRVIAKDGNTIGLTNVVGAFVVGETAGSVTVTRGLFLDGLDEVEASDAWQLLAESYYRGLIQPVPGTGPILGCVQYKDRAYAFRESAGLVQMYRTTPAGWEQVPFGQVLFFSAAAGEIGEGATITGVTSTATGTVRRFVRNAGVYGTDASGYMVIDSSGTFTDGEDIEVDSVVTAVAEGNSAPITLTAGGNRFEFDQYNFFGGADTFRLYGCDGVNPAWEFDGEVFAPIYFPAPEVNPSFNKPRYIVGHKSHLFLALPGGRMVSSGVGEPLALTAILGAAEFGLGSEITGMAIMAGDVLAIYTRRMTFGLYGATEDDWNLQVVSESFGARDYTVQRIGTVYALDDKGIAPLARVQAYGDFESATVSRFVKPILDEYQNRVVGSVTIRERNQYRLFFDDGTALVMMDDAYQEGSLPSFGTVRFPVAPTCINNSPDENQNEVILFGSQSGFVYQMERGYNFDGETVEFAYRSPFMNQKSPHIRKAYRRIFLDLDTSRSVRLQISTEIAYGKREVPANPASNVNVIGGGGYYDIDNWDEIYWSADTFASRAVSLAGTGRNISILIYGNSPTVRPFTIQTIEVHYLPRRMKRV